MLRGRRRCLLLLLLLLRRLLRFFTSSSCGRVCHFVSRRRLARRRRRWHRALFSTPSTKPEPRWCPPNDASSLVGGCSKGGGRQDSTPNPNDPIESGIVSLCEFPLFQKSFFLSFLFLNSFPPFFKGEEHHQRSTRKRFRLHSSLF